MLKTVITVAAVALATHMAVTIHKAKKEEEKYFNFIGSGRFLTEYYKNNH